MKAICDLIEERRELLVQHEDQEVESADTATGVLSSLRRFFGMK
jgi:hypothetical protein